MLSELFNIEIAGDGREERVRRAQEILVKAHSMKDELEVIAAGDGPLLLVQHGELAPVELHEWLNKYLAQNDRVCGLSVMSLFRLSLFTTLLLGLAWGVSNTTDPKEDSSEGLLWGPPTGCFAVLTLLLLAMARRNRQVRIINAGLGQALEEGLFDAPGADAASVRSGEPESDSDDELSGSDCAIAF